MASIFGLDANLCQITTDASPEIRRHGSNPARKKPDDAAASRGDEVDCEAPVRRLHGSQPLFERVWRKADVELLSSIMLEPEVLDQLQFFYGPHAHHWFVRQTFRPLCAFQSFLLLPFHYGTESAKSRPHRTTADEELFAHFFYC